MLPITNWRFSPCLSKKCFHTRSSNRSNNNHSRNRDFLPFISSTVTLLALLFTSSLRAETYTFNRENTLGTTMEVTIISNQKSVALRGYQSMVKEIDRLNLIFNHRLPNSEVTRLQKAPRSQPVRVSPELAQVLNLSIKGNKLSHGRYSIFTSQLTKLWKAGEKNQTVPSKAELHTACQSIAKADKHLRLDLKRRILSAPPELPIDLDSLAKGYIIDQCLAKLKSQRNITAAMVNIGGDIATFGKNTPWIVKVQNPTSSDTIQEVNLPSGAIATSGPQYRFYTIKDKKYSHIIDARTGMPVTLCASITVTSTKAVFADMLATMASTQSPQNAISMIDALNHCACLVVTPDGPLLTSKRWGKRTSSSNGASHHLSPHSQGVKKIQISWKQKYASRTNKKHRHFTVVWIENEKGEKVRDLALWYKRKKSKYLRKFKSWWSHGGSDLLGNKSVLKTISSASKRAGRYDVTWDHKNQDGKLLPPGIYYVHIEVNREKGPNKETPSVVE